MTQEFEPQKPFSRVPGKMTRPFACHLAGLVSISALLLAAGGCSSGSSSETAEAEPVATTTPPPPDPPPTSGTTPPFQELFDQGIEFMMSTRDGTGSELMIFLQAGGACSSRSCEAVETATVGFPSFGILSNAPNNPAGTYNVGYLP